MRPRGTDSKEIWASSWIRTDLVSCRPHPWPFPEESEMKTDSVSSQPYPLPLPEEAEMRTDSASSWLPPDEAKMRTVYGWLREVTSATSCQLIFTTLGLILASSSASSFSPISNQSEA